MTNKHIKEKKLKVFILSAIVFLFPMFGKISFSQPPPIKHLKIGINIGYLGDLSLEEVFTSPLRRIKKDGINDLRIYEPFTMGLSNSKRISILSKIIQIEGFNVLLSLSNYPAYSSKKLNRLKEVAKSTNASRFNMLRYTNRYPPNNYNTYAQYLTNFIDTLKKHSLLSRIAFEIGNEPDASRYFWGTPADFKKIYITSKQILIKTGRPFYCCAFTFGTINGTKRPYSFMLSLLKKENVPLSFHYYPNNKNELSSVLKLNSIPGSAITEFNLFSYQRRKSKQKIQEANSPQLVTSLAKIIAYSYANDITSLYIFNLVDNPKKNGTLGLFSADGQPKLSYTFLIKVYNLIKNGYSVVEDAQYIKIYGKTQSLILSKMDTSPHYAPQSVIAQSFDHQYSGELKKNQWIIINN